MGYVLSSFHCWYLRGQVTWKDIFIAAPSYEVGEGMLQFLNLHETNSENRFQIARIVSLKVNHVKQISSITIKGTSSEIKVYELVRTVPLW